MVLNYSVDLIFPHGFKCRFTHDCLFTEVDEDQPIAISALITKT